MTDLLTWFRAALAADERARAPKLGQRTPEAHENDCPGDDEGCLCRRPAFVLADIAAKRAILDLHAPATDPAPFGTQVYCAECGRWSPFACRTVRVLVSAYSGHPGYRAEWRP